MDDLLQLAASAPDRVPEAARRILAVSTDPGERSLAHQSLGIVYRDSGHLDEALVELRHARTFARRSDDGRARDVRATYGATLVFAGRTELGMKHLRQASSGPSDEVRYRVLMRYAAMLAFVGRHQQAHTVMAEALAGIREADDDIWLARTLNNLGYVELALGRLDEAHQHVAEAVDMFRVHGATLEERHALENLGAIASSRGDVVRALRLYDEASGSTSPRPGLVHDRASAMLSVGLVNEAIDELNGRIARGGLVPMDRIRLDLALGQAQLAHGDAHGAMETAARARSMLQHQPHHWFELRARWMWAQAHRSLGTAHSHADELRRVAEEMASHRADDAPLALVLAADVVSDAERTHYLRRASEYRRSPTPLHRAVGWWAVGLQRADEVDRGGVLRACDRGLMAVDDHRAGLGSGELAALATAHGRDLAALAIRHAADEPRALLRWAERSRATALHLVPVTASGGTPSTALAALRDNGSRLAAARAAGSPVDRLLHERDRLERAVRSEHHRQSRDGGRGPARVDVAGIVAEVGDATLVELVDVDGVLHVLVVHDGRVRRTVAGTTAAALELVGFARFALRRAARSGRFDLGDLGARLQEELLGEAVRLPGLRGEGPLVVSPPGRLHGVPWALLPALADRPFTVVPSAATWLRARGRVPATQRVALVGGPGLGTGGAELPGLAARYPGAVVLTGADATVEAGLAALDGARLAHVAAHGHFRADSPLFSSLELADGPLTVHELERLGAAPHRMVLSACESGVLAPVGADELLGLAAALFSLGSAGLVCSVAEVDDAATASLMIDLHEGLATTPDDLGSALLTMRRAAAGDPVRVASASAFVALGT